MSDSLSSDENSTAIEALGLHDQAGSLEGLALSEDYKVGELLLKHNHADVYSVLSAIDGSPLTNLKARACIVKGIPEKVRKHRLRSIKRLASRNVLEIRQGDSVVVVYKQEQTDDLGLKSEDENPLLKDRPYTPNEGTKSKEKSDIQREAARLRQLEKRKAKRQNAKPIDGPTKGNGVSSSIEESHVETDNEETLYVLLHLAYNNRPELGHEAELLPTSRAVLENYRKKQSLKFETALEMEEFADIKLQEAIFFRRQQSRLPGHMKARKEKFEKILRERGRFPRGSQEYESMKIGVATAQHKMVVIRHVQEILPTLISKADNIHQEIEGRVNLLELKQLEMEEIKLKITKKERLERQVVFRARVCQEVMPGSDPYAQAVRLFHAAERDLENLEECDWAELNAILENIQDECNMLLTIPSELIEVGERSIE